MTKSFGGDLFAGKVEALYRGGQLTQSQIAEKMTTYGVPTPQVRVSAILAKPAKFRLTEIEAFAAVYGLTAGFLPKQGRVEKYANARKPHA